MVRDCVCSYFPWFKSYFGWWFYVVIQRYICILVEFLLVRQVVECTFAYHYLWPKLLIKGNQTKWIQSHSIIPSMSKQTENRRYKKKTIKNSHLKKFFAPFWGCRSLAIFIKFTQIFHIIYRFKFNIVHPCTHTLAHIYFNQFGCHADSMHFNWTFILLADNVEPCYTSQLQTKKKRNKIKFECENYKITTPHVCIYFFFRIRGRLGSLLMLNVTIGILVGFIAGTHLPYHTVPKIFLPAPCIFFLLFIFFPETPHYFISRKNFDVRIPQIPFYWYSHTPTIHKVIARNMEMTVKYTNKMYACTKQYPTIHFEIHTRTRIHTIAYICSFQ